MLTRKKIIIIVSIILLAVVSFIFYSILSAYKASESFATNIRFADSLDEKVRFFTGANFAEINATSGKTTSISPIHILPSVNSVEWGKENVLIQATDYTKVDDLNSILQSINKPTETSYWWSYNLKLDKFQLIIDPQLKRPAIDVQWVNENEYIYMVPAEGETDSSEKIYTDFYLRTADGNESKLVSYDAKGLDEVESIVGKNSSYIFVTIFSGEELRFSKIDIKTGKESVIEKGINREVATSPDGNSFIISKHDTKTKSESEVASLSDIYFLNGGSKKKIASGFYGISKWNKKSNSFITYGEDSKGNSEVIFTSTDINKVINLEKSTDEGLALNSVLVNTNINDLLLVDENNSIFHYSKNTYNNVPKLQDDEVLHGDFYEDSFNINYFPDDKAYNIYVNNPFNINSKKALDYIKDKNIDPNQLNIRWYPNY